MLENKIRKLLLQAGVDPSLTGYEYLRMAVCVEILMMQEAEDVK